MRCDDINETESKCYNYKRSNLSCYLDIKILVYLNLFSFIFMVKKLGEIGPLFYEISGRVLNF